MTLWKRVHFNLSLKKIHYKVSTVGTLASRIHFNSACLLKPCEVILKFILIHGVGSPLKHVSRPIFRSWPCRLTPLSSSRMCRSTCCNSDGYIKLGFLCQTGEDRTGGETTLLNNTCSFYWCLWRLPKHKRWI